MYIHQSTCISPQQTFTDIANELHNLATSVDRLKALEPPYTGIPLNSLRRMGKAVRMGVGAALLLIEKVKPDGIIIGTANGGMEDCIKFLNQIIDYNEGALTPTNFVQSTPNSVAAQIGLITRNTGYNITHVHGGLAFENAITDVMMLLMENQNLTYLLGAIDEISDYNYVIEQRGNWYKNPLVNNHQLYESKSAGSIAGEGTAMFLCNTLKEGAVAKLTAIKTLHTNDVNEVAMEFQLFTDRYIADKNLPYVLITGENGDSRLLPYYEACEKLVNEAVTVVRFKHYCGEYPTASAFALWLSCRFLLNQNIPQHFIKNKSQSPQNISTIIIYNNYKGAQHSFMMVEKS